MIRNLILRAIPVPLRKKLELWKNRGQVDEVYLVYQLLKHYPGARVMFDVGAYHGKTLELFAYRGWTVYAFEPDPVNRSKLLKIANRYPNVRVEPLALGESPGGELTLYRSEVSGGISSLLKFHESHFEGAVVPVTTIAHYCQENQVPRITFLKIDTEGYDLMVLRGFDWERGSKPIAIVCEFDNYKTTRLGYSLNDLSFYLEDKGYRCIISEWHPIEEYGRSHRWRRFVTSPKRVSGDRVWGNIIAVLPEFHDKLMDLCAEHGEIFNENQ